MRNPRFYVAVIAWNIVYYTAKCSLIAYLGKEAYQHYHSNSNSNHSALSSTNDSK